jgi:hypothetical protein
MWKIIVILLILNLSSNCSIEYLKITMKDSPMTYSNSQKYFSRNAFLIPIVFTTMVSCSSGGGESSPPVQPPLEALSRVSVSSNGVEGDDLSQGSGISGDGRFVTFDSYATNLVDNDTNGQIDVFVRDTLAGTTSRISVPDQSLSDNEGNGYSGLPRITSDGRFIVFESMASNLVSGDTNDKSDIFVRDTQTNETIRVSVHTNGAQGTFDSYYGAISADGRFVAFNSQASELVDNDNNDTYDVFVHEISTRTTSRVSVSSSDSEGDSGSDGIPDISGDGRYVVFGSDSTNLVPDDTNNNYDVFVHDRVTQETKRISVNNLAEQGNGESYYSKISEDGSLIVFSSEATNLTDDNNDGVYDDDTNGVLDFFISDWQNGVIVKITRNASGEEANGDSYAGDSGSISGDNRFIVFESSATNLTEEGVSGTFIYDRLNQTIDLIDGNGSYAPTISADGKYIGLTSPNDALVENDTNASSDVFKMPNNR